MKLANPLRLAACCLNISEGRSIKVLERIAEAAVRDQEKWTTDEEVSDNDTFTCKSVVLSLYSDTVFNRGNITIAAPVEYLHFSVTQACQEAFESVNLEDHLNPGHPRLGVVDLIPIHPLSHHTSLEACVKVAHMVVDELSKNIVGSSYFFFGAADKENRGLVARRKQMNWFSYSGPNCKPDVGECASKYGVTAVGAIPYMSVLNIELDTNDLSVGKDIASAIRASNQSTGLPGIQAMAFRKGDSIEVACNVDTNLLTHDEVPVFKTTFETLESAIRRYAEMKGVKVLGESLRGFSPQQAYRLAEQSLKDGDTSVWKRTLATVM